MRAANDFYPTPFSIIEKLLSQLDWPAGTLVWSHASETAELPMHWSATGTTWSPETSPLAMTFEVTAAKSPYLLTNPPFSHIRQFIDHAFDIGVEKMALVCPERLWACQRGRKQLLRHRPGQFVNMDWREDYLGKGGAPDRALAVSIWTAQTTPRRILMSGTALRSVDICSRYVLLFSNTRGTEK